VQLITAELEQDAFCMETEEVASIVAIVESPDSGRHRPARDILVV
jgi:hypothetical protein